GIVQITGGPSGGAGFERLGRCACRRCHNVDYSLFHRYTLRQIAGLVDVAAARDRRVVGDELERDDAQERLERLGGVGDLDDVVAVAADVGVSLGGDDDDLSAAGADFFDVVDDLVVLNAARR